MADAKLFHCSVVTPERAVFEGDVHFVALPAHDGEIGILRHRAPLLCKLDVGSLRIDTGDGTDVYYVDGGFAEMVDNRLSILTEDAKLAAELDRERAEAALAEAREIKATGPGSAALRERALKRAKVQLRMLKNR